jgi:hypothetical protein
MLPDTIDLPRPEDFCRGKVSDGAGRHCTVGWIYTLLPNATWRQRSKFRHIWRGAPSLKHLRLPKYSSVDDANDSHDVTDEQLAEAFEYAVLKLGYEVSK